MKYVSTHTQREDDRKTLVFTYHQSDIVEGTSETNADVRGRGTRGVRSERCGKLRHLWKPIVRRRAYSGLNT